MVVALDIFARSAWIGLILTAIALGSPALAERGARAQLVHCAGETCLRIAGHRSSPAVVVRIAGRDLAVEGGRNWRATVPLRIARSWALPVGGVLPVTLTDPQDGIETSETVELPPGAIGPRVDLAMLVVRAH